MEARLVKHDAVDRPLWDAFLADSPQGAFFARPAFMDIIAPGWQAIEVWDKDELQAVFPLNIRRKAGYTYSLQPLFAQHWGIFFKSATHTNDYRQYSWKRKVVVAMIESMPRAIRLFIHCFAPEFDYATPFHWQGYELRTRYTYRLDVDASPEDLLARLDKDKRSELKQAEKAGVLVSRVEDLQALYALAGKNEDEGKSVAGSASPELLKRVAEYLCAGNGGFVLQAEQAGKPIAAGLFVRDKHKTVYILGVQDPQQRKLGGMNAVLWEAIQQSAGPGRIFDFEGSMIEPIEGFFRSFGAVPVPYLLIQKNRLPLLVRWIRNSR